MIRRERFRSPQGVYRTKALFYEMVLSDKSSVVYTLKPEDHEGYPSLKKCYMTQADPTEYEFAIEYFAGWEHWTKLLECDWFTPFITQWRMELELKLKAIAYQNVFSEATDKSKNSFMANKYILENYKRFNPATEESHGRGRPSKSEIASEAFKIASSQYEIDADSKRVLRVVN